MASEICLAKNPRIRIHSFISKENLGARFFGEKIRGYKNNRLRKLDATSPFARQTFREARLSAVPPMESNSHRGLGMHTRTHRRYAAADTV